MVGATFDFGREGSARLSAGGRSDRRARGSSLSSRRESPLLGRFADSPSALMHEGDGFEFDGELARLTSSQLSSVFYTVSGDIRDPGDADQSNPNLRTLEKSSFDFLEYAHIFRVCKDIFADACDRYAKMQLNANPSDTGSLSFDDIVQKPFSTRRVAAAAFYHCLGMCPFLHQAEDNPERISFAVLTTKDLLGVSQESPYDAISITVK